MCCRDPYEKKLQNSLLLSATKAQVGSFEQGNDLPTVKHYNETSVSKMADLRQNLNIKDMCVWSDVWCLKSKEIANIQSTCWVFVPRKQRREGT